MKMEQITFEEFGQILDEVAETLPKDIFINLNGGISLLPETLHHPDNNNLFILGQYHYGGYLGRYITIYYGSFVQLYGRSSKDFYKQEIDRVLRHEFLHHLESMAGEKELEIKDAIRLEHYKRNYLYDDYEI